MDHFRSRLKPDQDEASGGDGASDDGSMGAKKIKKRKRVRLTPQQLAVMERVFWKNRYPNSDHCRELANEMQLPHHSVQIWFQNRRAKYRRMQKKSLTGGPMPDLEPPRKPGIRDSDESPNSPTPSVPSPSLRQVTPGTPFSVLSNMVSGAPGELRSPELMPAGQDMRRMQPPMRADFSPFGHTAAGGFRPGAPMDGMSRAVDNTNHFVHAGVTTPFGAPALGIRQPAPFCGGGFDSTGGFPSKRPSVPNAHAWTQYPIVFDGRDAECPPPLDVSASASDGQQKWPSLQALMVHRQDQFNSSAGSMQAFAGSTMLGAPAVAPGGDASDMQVDNGPGMGGGVDFHALDDVWAMPPASDAAQANGTTSAPWLGSYPSQARPGPGSFDDPSAGRAMAMDGLDHFDGGGHERAEHMMTGVPGDRTHEMPAAMLGPLFGQGRHTSPVSSTATTISLGLDVVHTAMDKDDFALNELGMPAFDAGDPGAAAMTGMGDPLFGASRGFGVWGADPPLTDNIFGAPTNGYSVLNTSGGLSNLGGLNSSGTLPSFGGFGGLGNSGGMGMVGFNSSGGLGMVGLNSSGSLGPLGGLGNSGGLAALGHSGDLSASGGFPMKQPPAMVADADDGTGWMDVPGDATNEVWRQKIAELLGNE